jgi:hypothetical protein
VDGVDFEDSSIDAVVPWLLRVGIDHSGKLDTTQLWDVGIRGGILADLWLSRRITDAGETLEIDTEPTGIPYLDTAVHQLAESGNTLLEWLGRDWLRATDVADEFVRAGEWTVRRSFTASRWRIYRSQAVQQYVPLRRRVAHVYDGDIPPASATEATVALLGHALNVVRPDKWGRPAFEALRFDACGRAASIVEATISSILALSRSAGANSDPAY